MVGFGCTIWYIRLHSCRARTQCRWSGLCFIASELTLIVPIKKRCGKGMPPLSRWPFDHTMHP